MPPRCWGPTTPAWLVRDGWAPYRCFDGLHQTCLNHLLQRCKQLREDHPDSPWASEVQAVLRAGLDLRDRCNAGALSEHGMATARGRLTARLARLVDAPPPLDDAERFAAHLATEFPAVFLFLWDPSLDATNWRAEQAIRPAVVIRKVCGGNRTRHGADTQQVLASVVRTARQRNLDLPPLITAMLRAAEPVVPELLGLPPPPRVGGQPPNNDFESATGPRGAPPQRGASRLHCARSPPDFADRPTSVRSVRLPPVSHRGIATVATVEATRGKHTIPPSNLVGDAETSSLQAHLKPVSIGQSPEPLAKLLGLAA